MMRIQQRTAPDRQFYSIIAKWKDIQDQQNISNNRNALIEFLSERQPECTLAHDTIECRMANKSKSTIKTYCLNARE